jgi:hypothetical protein
MPRNHLTCFVASTSFRPIAVVPATNDNVPHHGFELDIPQWHPRFREILVEEFRSLGSHGFNPA